MSTEALGLWTEAKKELSLVLEPVQFSTWVERLQFVDFVSSDNKLILSAPSNFVKNICMQWIDKFNTVLTQIMGMPITVEIEVAAVKESEPSSPAQNVTPQQDVSNRSPAIPSEESDSDQPKHSENVSQQSSNVRNDEGNTMTFESFVVSDSNEYAAATARAIAERPGFQYNPLMIYGDSGLGKTHLLHAIENYVRRVFPTKKVKFVTAEGFLNDFVAALRNKTNEHFRITYRNLDLLLIDDIQYLCGKTDTQMELFNTFNRMVENHKQMVFSCDQHPEKLQGMEQRLVTRFVQGLTVALPPPDFEARMAILMNWAETNRLKIDNAAAEYVAANVIGSVRKMQGVFNHLLMTASIRKKSVITKEDAAAWLKDKGVITTNAAPVSVDKIISETASYFHLKPNDLKGESRVKDIAYARQIAMTLCRRLTKMSTTQIGAYFGNKQHGTVISNVNKIQTLLDAGSEQTVYDIETLTKKVSES